MAVALQQTAVTPTTEDIARRLLTRGTNFFGWKETSYVLGEASEELGPNPDDFPSLPSERAVSRAKELGQRLILSGPVAMDRLHDLLGNELEGDKLLYDTSWYQAEVFYRTLAAAKWHWRFTGEHVIDGSAGQNYLDQTRTLIAYLQTQMFDGQPMSPKFTQAIEEFKQNEEAIAKLMNDWDWPKAAEQLAALQINQLCRETPDQVLWDIVLNKKVNGVYVLPGMYAWTKTRSSRGYLVYVGTAVEYGVDVDVIDPRYADDDLGVRFSCSAEDLAT